jgi:hypothetical protein
MPVIRNNSWRVFSAGLFLDFGVGFDRGQGRQVVGGIPAGLDDGEMVFDFGVAGGQLGGEEVEQFEGLLEGKEVFVAPVASEGFDEGGFIGLAARLAVSGRGLGVTFTGHNGSPG